MLNQLIGQMVNTKINGLLTAFVADVTSISFDGSTAMVKPRSMAGAPEKAEVEVIIPPNIKTKPQTLELVTDAETTIETGGAGDNAHSHGATTTLIKEKVDVFVPTPLEVGDVVYCGVCDTELHEVNDGSERIHDINNSVILRVLDGI